MFKLSPTVSLAALALALPAAAQAQNYDDLPPLSPMSEAEVRTLPVEYRTAPVMAQTEETVTVIDGVETITRTRRIDSPRALPVAPQPAYAPQAYPAPAMGYAPAVFERDQWIAECQRRTRGQNRDDTGKIIGGLLGAIAGGFAGYEIAGVGDRVLGTVLGVGGGGLIGGLLGSLFDGDKKKNLYECEAALDSYLSAYGTPGPRIASREIAYPAYGYGYGYPQAYSYGYSYAPPPQMVLVPVRTEVQQQVVVRETVREETYSVPRAPAERIIPDRRPSPKMIKQR
ncbi:hypothetical protein [Erythrobacter donghaensis]|uniref:hypothetical protein n=1 Tax=Erythrobacter donghaensis TaxID=267135 RepID=UPI000A3820C0|nr:hypothetical protein [Erythrobacter donghaensis]